MTCRCHYYCKCTCTMMQFSLLLMNLPCRMLFFSCMYYRYIREDSISLDVMEEKKAPKKRGRRTKVDSFTLATIRRAAHICMKNRIYLTTRKFSKYLEDNHDLYIPKTSLHRYFVCQSQHIQHYWNTYKII